MLGFPPLGKVLVRDDFVVLQDVPLAPLVPLHLLEGL